MPMMTPQKFPVRSEMFWNAADAKRYKTGSARDEPLLVDIGKPIEGGACNCEEIALDLMAS